MCNEFKDKKKPKKVDPSAAVTGQKDTCTEIIKRLHQHWESKLNPRELAILEDDVYPFVENDMNLSDIWLRVKARLGAPTIHEEEKIAYVADPDDSATWPSKEGSDPIIPQGLRMIAHPRPDISDQGAAQRYMARKLNSPLTRQEFNAFRMAIYSACMGVSGHWKNICVQLDFLLLCTGIDSIDKNGWEKLHKRLPAIIGMMDQSMQTRAVTLWQKCSNNPGAPLPKIELDELRRMIWVTCTGESVAEDIELDEEEEDQTIGGINGLPDPDVKASKPTYEGIQFGQHRVPETLAQDDPHLTETELETLSTPYAGTLETDTNVDKILRGIQVKPTRVKSLDDIRQELHDVKLKSQSLGTFGQQT